MKKLLQFIFLLSVLLLVSCSSKPNDKEAFQHIRNSENVAGITRVENIVRKNGWPDGENTYLVEYTYDLVAEKNYEDLTTQFLVDISKNSENYFPSGFNGVGVDIAIKAALSSENSGGLFVEITRNNLQNEEDGRKFLDIGRRIREKELPTRFKLYLSQGDKNEEFNRAKNLLFAIMETEGKGIRPGIKAGDVYMNKVWKLAFRKTENGWKLK